MKNWLSFSCWLRPTSTPLTKRRSLACPSLFRSCPTQIGAGRRVGRAVLHERGQLDVLRQVEQAEDVQAVPAVAIGEAVLAAQIEIVGVADRERIALVVVRRVVVRDHPVGLHLPALAVLLVQREHQSAIEAAGVAVGGQHFAERREGPVRRPRPGVDATSVRADGGREVDVRIVEPRQVDGVGVVERRADRQVGDHLALDAEAPAPAARIAEVLVDDRDAGVGEDEVRGVDQVREGRHAEVQAGPDDDAAVIGEDHAVGGARVGPHQAGRARLEDAGRGRAPPSCRRCPDPR